MAICCLMWLKQAASEVSAALAWCVPYFWCLWRLEPESSERAEVWRCYCLICPTGLSSNSRAQPRRWGRRLNWRCRPTLNFAHAVKFGCGSTMHDKLCSHACRTIVLSQALDCIDKWGRSAGEAESRDKVQVLELSGGSEYFCPVGIDCKSVSQEQLVNHKQTLF